MKSLPLIIGLTGSNASGKGEVAKRLVQAGFTYHSLSDIVREEALASGLTTCRDDLIATGNRLRRENGPGILAERIIPRLGVKDVVDSIRNPSEVEVLRKVKGFVLLGIQADAEIRYERARNRHGRGDAVESLEEFLAKEAEENTTDPDAQRLEATFALADHVIENNGTIEELSAAIEIVLKSLKPNAV